MKKHWEIDHDEEQGDEGGMALGNLGRSQSMISQLQNVIEDDDTLPAWVQSKLTSVYEDLDDVHGYMLGQDSEEVSEGKKKKGLWDNIWARRRAGKRPHRPGEKGYPKTLDIEEDVDEDDDKLDEDILREYISMMVEKKCKGYKKAPVGSPRQRSFCRRMCGMKKHNTGAEAKKDPDSCINQSLRRWRCRCS